MAASWDGFEEGDDLPELVKTPGVADLVKYAAGSGDFNPLHYDYASPHAKQIGTIIVHGRFKYALLGQLLSDWLGHQARIEKIACQYRGMDLQDQPMTARGRVSAKWEQDGERRAEIEVWVENAEGKKTTPGSAVVVFD